MLNFLTKDWGDLLFDKLSMKVADLIKRKESKLLEEEKRLFIEDNTVIVTINDTVIYNSTTDGVMNDDLYNALLSYGVEKDVKSLKKNRDNTLVCNLNPTITPIILK